MLSNGLYTTLMALNLHLHGMSAMFIGTLTGVYYIGLAYGSFKIEKYIIDVGHIRAFAAFTALIIVVCLLQGLIFSPWLWLVARFLAGFGTAGIYVVIESWLLAVGSVKTRGQILAFYMIALYAGQALGQFMINFSSPEKLNLFVLTAMLSALAIIPITLIKTPSPEITEPSSLGFKKLLQSSASAVYGSFSSGLVLGAIYGLLPLFVIQKTESESQVSVFMALVIFGGMALQYPVGKLSDFIERRLVLLCLSLLTMVGSIIIIFGFQILFLSYGLIFLLGGLTFTLYPVSVSYACDNLKDKDIVSGTQSILLAYSVGAAIGPFIAPIFIHLIGDNGLFIYLAAVCVPLSLLLIWRKRKIRANPQEESFRVMPQTTPITAALDPRKEEMS